MKLCKDCKWCSPNPNGIPSMDKCTSPNIKRRVDYVYGKQMNAYCDIERSKWKSCSPDARFFEPINLSESESKPETFWQRLFN